jgi:hypothetical protein
MRLEGLEDAPSLDDADDEGEDDGDGTLDLLEVVNNLCARYSESYEQVMRWTWKVFCGRWGKAIRAAARERAEAARRDDEAGNRGSLVVDSGGRDGGW